MLSLTRLLTLRSLRVRPLRMLLSTFGIVLGVAAILAIGITNQTAMTSVTQLFKETSGKSNLIVTSTDPENKGFSDNILPRLKSFPNILVAAPSVQLSTLLAKEAAPAQLGLTFFGENVGGLSLFGIDPTVDPSVRQYKLSEGNFLSADLNADEIVLVRDFAEDNELTVGKWVEVVAGTGIEKLRLVGLIEKEGAGQLNNGAFGVIPLKTAQRLFYRTDVLDQVDLVVAPDLTGATQLETLRSGLQENIGGQYAILYPASQGRRMTDMLSSYQIGLNFLSGMALFVGAFLIFNAFQMTVVERTREFGMLRTVGMTRGQITRQVLAEAIVLGVLGTGMGILLGIWMARGLTRLMEILLGQNMTTIQVPQATVITGAVVGMLVTILAALIPAFQAGRISPLEALRARSQSREGCLIRLGWIPGSIMLFVSAIILVINPFPYDVQFRMGSLVVVFLFLGGTLLIPVSVGFWEIILRPLMRIFLGRSGQIGSSNVRRARLRTTLTVGALMIGVAMIVIVWAMTLSFKGDLDSWLKGYIGGDLYVTSSLPMGNDVRRRLESVDGVAAVAPSRYFEIEWKPTSGKREKVMFRAIDPASYNRITSFIYSQVLSDSKSAIELLNDSQNVFISSVISEKYGLKAGDTINLITKLGEQKFKVAAVVVDYYNQGLVIDGNWTDMWHFFRQQDANAYLVKVMPGYTASQVASSIDHQYGKRDRLTIISNQQLLQQVSNLMNSAFRMFDVLAVISILVGFFGITNTLTMNVMERTQEIGMLRSVGMIRSQVVKMVMAEAALMGAIGGILGIVFGIILSHIFMLAMTAMSGYNLTYVLPVQRILIALLIAVLISLIAAFFPSLRAARLRVLEAIHYE